MDWIIKLFSQAGTAHAVLLLCLSIFGGIIIGKPKIKGINLGIAGVLFSGLLVGHFGGKINHEVMHFAKELGLIFFVFSIGLEVGPRFFSTFKREGIGINILAASIVIMGVGIAAAIHFAFNVPVPEIAGILCGAVTNTPSLGAAQQVLADQGGILAAQTPTVGMGYAVAYPFGIIGIILTMLLIKLFFKIKVDKELEEYDKKQEELSQAPEAFNLEVTNPNADGKTIQEIKKLVHESIIITRLFRDNIVRFPKENEKIHVGDILRVVVDQAYTDSVHLTIGKLSSIDLRRIDGKLAMRQMMVTNKSIAGKTIRQLNIYGRYSANITRIYRSGLEFIPKKDVKIELGDTIRVVGEKNTMDAIAKEVGNSHDQLNHPNILPLFLGIFLGVVVGSIPFTIPGLPAAVKLGLAGGPLLVAILMGHFGRVGKTTFYIPSGANLILRETGIALFLACVGISSGGKLISTIVDGGGLAWMGYGVAITFIPILTVGIIARLLKYNYLTICGFVAGSMTDPPALGFANTIIKSQAQNTAYASVYPLVMFLRVLLAQILILALL
ncbi:MAG: putative transporter [Bacteroidota bacterium]|nr:putative transporter [Bacteroidota bacterium]